MKVLFVSSKKGVSVSPIILNQGKSLEDHNIKVEYFAVSRGLKGYIHAIYSLYILLKHKKYSLIHAHYGLCGIVALIAARKMPIVVSFMGDDLIGSIKNGKYTKISKLLAIINDMLSRHFYNYVIVKSELMYFKLKRRTNISIIPNGVDLSKFFIINKQTARNHLGLAIDKKYIIFVSNPEIECKNFLLAESAVRRIGNENIILLVVINKPNHELLYYYNAADCLILTSFHEGSPNVIKEAMACSCPIVSTDVGDVRWILGNIDGCYLTDFDVDDVAEKIRQALQYAQTFDRTSGRERVIELGLDSTTIANKLSEIYKKVISN